MKIMHSTKYIKFRHKSKNNKICSKEKITKSIRIFAFDELFLFFYCVYVAGDG